MCASSRIPHNNTRKWVKCSHWWSNHTLSFCHYTICLLENVLLESRVRRKQLFHLQNIGIRFVYTSSSPNSTGRITIFMLLLPYFLNMVRTTYLEVIENKDQVLQQNKILRMIKLFFFFSFKKIILTNEWSLQG